MKVQTHANEDTRERRDDALPGDALHHEQKPNELTRWVPKWSGYWDYLKQEKKNQEGKDAA